MVETSSFQKIEPGTKFISQIVSHLRMLAGGLFRSIAYRRHCPIGIDSLTESIRSKRFLTKSLLHEMLAEGLERFILTGGILTLTAHCKIQRQKKKTRQNNPVG